MKLIIFGATGATGRQLVSQALKQGHDVTAFARSPEKFEQKHAGLKLLKGDVLDSVAVEKAIQGQDAVFCSLGMPNIMDKSKLRSKGTRNIVAGMQKAGVKRLICLSGLGAGESFQILPFHYRYLIVPLIMRHLYADHNQQESYVRASRLDWTIARPGSLTDGEYTGDYQEYFGAENNARTIKISRADTADFMLKQLEDNSYLHKAPCLSY